MRRLCIFVTYDCKNIVDAYIGYMLQELRKAANCLIVVCNYPYIVDGMDYIQPYADKIYYRENIGYDAGAYKDALCLYLSWNEIYQFDELLLVNDSFYGPLYSLSQLFVKMEKIDVDYWGLTKCPEIEFADGHTCRPHIQSYFLAFRKNILQSKEFQKFWEEMKYPASLMQAVIKYELGINEFLHESGFHGTSVMELCSVQFQLKKNENPYILYPLELIRDAALPVLKRKSLNIENRRFGNAIEALRFIQSECSYDVSLIENHLKRIGKGCNFMAIDDFYVEHPRIFIYGAGLYGRNLAMYFTYKGWIFEKFLVTDPEEQTEGCLVFEQADIKEEDGIIIAVGNEKAFAEILHLLKKRCQKNQIFNTEGMIW